MDYCVNIPREEREFHNLKTSNKFSFNSAKTRKNQQRKFDIQVLRLAKYRKKLFFNITYKLNS